METCSSRSPRWHRQPAPVYTWPADSYGLTAYLADLLPGTPPGDYRLILTAFDKADPQTPLTAHAPDGVALGPSLDLGAIRVARPSRAPDPDDVPMQRRLDASMGPLTLVGVNLDRERAAPGDPALVTLFWRMTNGGEQSDLWGRLALIGKEGAEAMAWDVPPVRADWPTTQWQPGDLWRGQHLLRLPVGLESGDYSWQLRLYEPARQRVYEERVDLGQLHINAPQRLWQAPPLQLPLDADLGQPLAREVTLLGVNLEPGAVVSTTLTVTLAWQAQAEMTTSYRVFLHLLAPDASLLTQSDGEPANWSRPTTGWALGEVILDQRILTIPANTPSGQYVLVTGLYDADTGERLALPDASTAIPITTLAIKEP